MAGGTSLPLLINGEIYNMPVVKRTRSDEKTQSGKPVFIIRTPVKNYKGKRWEVNFDGGIGRTTSKLKARLFSESLGYKVIIPRGMEPWFEAEDKPAIAHLEEMEEEFGMDYEEEEWDDDDYEVREPVEFQDETDESDEDEDDSEEDED